eukprot:CAMPEP_0201720474 /NCGR_PEP_ID=MMETSP0593-20130828/5405_1 /ASSEMBLY_ACC=CAM_ASM_000672 /TAXON_ID=267983 /ORGANISM="Skeletonema japonicum, Strain CCMP2506" /LENGTH=47 /DNA_ID= /DNA_START= /DNA_END= /DNA_ORIENTATION=
MVATNAANVATPTPSHECINPTTVYAYKLNDNPPTTEANVPSRDMAP